MVMAEALGLLLMTLMNTIILLEAKKVLAGVWAEPVEPVDPII